MRVFTFLVGRQLDKAEHIQWMACNYKGDRCRSCVQNIVCEWNNRAVLSVSVLSVSSYYANDLMLEFSLRNDSQYGGLCSLYVSFW